MARAEAAEMPRSHEQVIADNVRISGENVRLRGAPPPELIERAEVLLGRRVRE